MVGSPMSSCHAVTGTWLVTSVEALGVILEDLEQVMAGDAGEGREPSRHPKYPALSVLATASGMPREAARTNTGGPSPARVRAGGG